MPERPPYAPYCPAQRGCAVGMPLSASTAAPGFLNYVLVFSGGGTQLPARELAGGAERAERAERSSAQRACGRVCRLPSAGTSVRAGSELQSRAGILITRSDLPGPALPGPTFAPGFLIYWPVAGTPALAGGASCAEHILCRNTGWNCRNTSYAGTPTARRPEKVGG
jgi:hypothetical protein